jgi:hypothetical protein
MFLELGGFALFFCPRRLGTGFEQGTSAVTLRFFVAMVSVHLVTLWGFVLSSLFFQSEGT